MSKLITFVILTAVVLTVSADGLSRRRALMKQKVTVGGGPTFIFDEGFEGTGTPTDWFASNSPDYDYSASPLVGSQSLRISNTSMQGGAVLPADEDEIWFKFRFRAQTSLVTTYFFVCRDSAFDPSARLALISTGELFIDSGTGSAQTTAQLSADTTYYIWFRAKKGSGANSEVEVWFNTTDTRPSSVGTSHALVTNGSLTTAVDNFQFQSTATASLVFDTVQVADAEFQ